MKNALVLIVFALTSAFVSFSQNIAINTDGTTAEAGVMLDVKGSNSITAVATQNIFQVKSLDASGTELKMRMILHTDATAGLRYGGLEVYDATAAAYRNLMLVPNGGNVVVGGTGAVGKLTVQQGANGYANGIITYGSGAVNGQYITMAATGSQQSTIQSADASNWQPLFINPNGGNVGIGITSPLSTLHTSGNLTVGSAATAGTVGNVQITSGGASPISNRLTFGTDGSGWKFAIAKNQAGTVTEILTAQDNGNVGIGTTSPGQKLDVQGNIAVGGSNGYGIYDWTNSDANWRIGMNNVDATVGFTRLLATSHVQYMTYSNGAGQGFAVGVNGGTSSFEIRGSDHQAYFRGSVGIGSTVLNAKLDVTNSTSGCIYASGTVNQINMLTLRDVDNAAATAWPGGAHVVIWPQTNGLGILRFVKSAISQWDFVDRSTANTNAGRRLAIHDANGVGDIMTLWGNGYVGIGTSSPSEKLEICGNLKVIGTINASSTINASQAIACSSDLRYKENIRPLKSSLQNVLSLRGVNYEWRKNDFPDKQFSGGNQIGFIAQEIEKIYPEVVYTDKDGYKSVDYSRLTPVLVEALKEQQQEILELRAMLEKLLQNKNSEPAVSAEHK